MQNTKNNINAMPFIILIITMISVSQFTQANKESITTTTISATVKKLIFPFRFLIFCLTRLAYYFLYKYGFIDKPTQPETTTSLSSNYIETLTDKFLKSFEQSSQTKYNENVEQCFYDTKLHSIAVEDAHNELEKTWNRRILLENTPRGNVIMHYDAYKQGFAYYSDNSNIPYFLLNAVAMKYVLLYKCRDFFIDSQITPENHRSPLLDLYIKQEQQNTTTTTTTITDTEKTNDDKPLLKSSAFAKLKTYNTISGKLSSQQTESNKNEHTMPENSNKYIRNKIIYSGKISNFHFTQKPKATKQVAFSSDLLDGLKENSNAQKNVFSYKDFKKLREQQTNAK